MRNFRAALAAAVAGLFALVTGQAHAQQTEVAFAGVAFAGDAQSIPTRFQYSSEYESSLRAANDSGFKRVQALLKQRPAQNLDVRFEPISELNGRDQAVVGAMVLTSETVSTEQFGDARKLFIQLRGQALFFDFKSMTVLRSYPFSFAYIDNLRHEPMPQEIRERVRMLFEGAGGQPGMYGRYADLLAAATVPAQTPRLLRVTNVSLPQQMVDALPPYLKADHTVYETWAADKLAEALSSRIGVPIIPYAKGAAVGGVMSMKVADGDVYNLTLPSPDYEISLSFKGLKKVKYGESGAGASWVYGVFVDLRIEQPALGTVYLNTPLKNAEVKVIPASQSVVDDFPAFDDSMHGLFAKFADAVASGDLKWVKAASGAPDIEAQLTKTKELMKQCK